MVHHAGPLVSGLLQRCDRCGLLLTDYRDVMVPEGSGSLRGWELGAAVEVGENFSAVTDAAPDCPVGGPGARRQKL